MSRVVLLDPGGTTDAVREGLGSHRRLEVEQADRLPTSGDDVIALLVAPEVPVGASQLEPLPGVRIVAATATGFDHLDLDAISAAGVWATHCPGYCDEEVAEHAIAFVLDLLRGVTLLDRSVRSGHWNQLQFEPRRIAGAVLGVVGLGRIGREVARRGQALGMRVIATDPLIGPSGAGAVELVSLEALLQTADAVTLHAPLTPQTRGMIGAAELGRIRPDAFLVNCARAGLVDHDALGDALRSGSLGGCALDVLPQEPPSPEEPALHWPRTLLNPHAAWYSPQSASAPYRMAGEAVAAVLEGRDPYGALARPAPAQPPPG
ncbi:MAG TPA: NAD(P)-dependent oxidoreductase [Solirubrobacteraceae bacterium]|jgi:D-3-phosphoglycerate dehydrogenase